MFLWFTPPHLKCYTCVIASNKYFTFHHLL
nr:MAG TPA: NUDIX hydrolase-like protein [Caudoviricetes sp.]DAJ96278.1 MAG TPA: NUDIX hydrolase-like protein [Caudoviricetes sp.]